MCEWDHIGVDLWKSTNFVVSKTAKVVNSKDVSC